MRALFAALLLLGCLAPPAVDDEAPWTEASGQPWFTLTTGCSACGFRSSEHVQADTLVVYDDGALLWFGFGLQSRSGNLSADAAAAAWIDEIQAMRVMQHDGWHNGSIHVFSAQAAWADAWNTTAADLAAQHPRLEEPPPPPNNCADCGAAWIEAFGPHVHAALRENYGEHEPWGRVLAHLRDLHQQAAPS